VGVTVLVSLLMSPVALRVGKWPVAGIGQE